MPESTFSALGLPRRRWTRAIQVGSLSIGGHAPIRVQSMLTCDTRDTEACVQQILALTAVGCELVRLAVPTLKSAINLEAIRDRLAEEGMPSVPLVADVHFKPEIALEAVKWVEKIRINPGNYADSKKFMVRIYTDSEYAAELARVEERFLPLVELCKKYRRALRIGVNHGSLSDRLLNRYGDTPLGMVESALEFARMARAQDFHQFLFSMKASNPKVMIAAYRLLVMRLEEEGPDWNYPIHLGVTEAGEGEDGRMKSAIGIGSLLQDGIGDTIRVSLTEDSVHEIPVARQLIAVTALPSGEDVPGEGKRNERWVSQGEGQEAKECGVWNFARWSLFDAFSPYMYARRPSERIEGIEDGNRERSDAAGQVAVGGLEPIRVFLSEKVLNLENQITNAMTDLLEDGRWNFQVEGYLDSLSLPLIAIDPQDDAAIECLNRSEVPSLVTVADGVNLPPVMAFRLLAARLIVKHPILLKDTLLLKNPVELKNPIDGAPQERSFHLSSALPREESQEALVLRAASVLGTLLCDGIGDAVVILGHTDTRAALGIAYGILQAAGVRIYKTDYVACPSCGRTLFDLQSTTTRIKAATEHLKGVRIGIMGCIVNGPGEMADADFGYVGGAPGKINLYVGKKPVEFNVPEDQAVDRLIALIQREGKWVEAS